jgi:hypothetical protein
MLEYLEFKDNEAIKVSRIVEHGLVKFELVESIGATLRSFSPASFASQRLGAAILMLE